jgi:hypothetical protein
LRRVDGKLETGACFGQRLLAFLLVAQMLLGALASLEQFQFVLVAIAGAEDRQFVELAAVPGPDHSVHDHRNSLAIRVFHFQLDLAERALHLQQRHPVRLVEDAAADRQQGVQALTDEIVANPAQPGAERPVDVQDGPVGLRQQQPTSSVLVERIAAGGVVHLR